MRKRVTAVALAGTVALGGVAVVAIPALADTTSTPSPSAAPGTPGADRGESRIKELLKGLVADKTITQDQADKVAKTLAEARGDRVRGGGPGHGGFGGGHGVAGVGGPEVLDAAAKALGMSTDDVRSALRDGSTLADLAKKQGKDEAAVVTAIVDAIKARVAQAVKDGKLTQDQADRITGSLQDRVKEGVENGRPMRGRGHGPDGMRGGAETPASPDATSQASSFVA